MKFPHKFWTFGFLQKFKFCQKLHIFKFRKKFDMHFFHFFFKKIFSKALRKFTKNGSKKQQKKCKKAMLFFVKFRENFGKFWVNFCHFFALFAHVFYAPLHWFCTLFLRPKKSVQNFKFRPKNSRKILHFFLKNFWQIFWPFSENRHRERGKFLKKLRKKISQNFRKILKFFDPVQNFKFKIWQNLHIFTTPQNPCLPP